MALHTLRDWDNQADPKKEMHLLYLTDKTIQAPNREQLSTLGTLVHSKL